MSAAPGDAFTARIQEYQQVGDQFRALTEIRFKLVGLLPVGTIATILATRDTTVSAEPAVAAFGLLVTLCLATYNERNDQLYDELTSRAAELERELGLKHGAFSQRPTSWLSYGPWRIEHGWPVGFVYAASAALWAYVLVNALAPSWKLSWNGTTYVPKWPWFAALAVVVGWMVLRFWEKRTQGALKEVVKGLKEALRTEPGEKLVESLLEAKEIRSIVRGQKAEETIKRRLAFQGEALQNAQKSNDSAELALVLSNVIGLPARWIEDVWTGRR